MAKEKAKGKLSQIVEPLQKLLDQRAELDKKIEEMKKTLIATIENDGEPAKQTAGKGPKAKKESVKKAPVKESIEKKPRGKKTKTKEAEES